MFVCAMPVLWMLPRGVLYGHIQRPCAEPDCIVQEHLLSIEPHLVAAIPPQLKNTVNE